jgi:hypothetical protein
VTLVWRAQIGLDCLAAPGHRLVVSLEDVTRGRMLQDVERDLMRGRFARAVTEAEVDVPANAVDHEVELARYRSLELTPNPALSLERYAEISSEMAAKSEPRAAILARNGLDETLWLIEERAWLERVGRAMSRGDLDVPVAFSDAMRLAKKVREQKDS